MSEENRTSRQGVSQYVEEDVDIDPAHEGRLRRALEAKKYEMFREQVEKEDKNKFADALNDVLLESPKSRSAPINELVQRVVIKAATADIKEEAEILKNGKYKEKWQYKDPKKQRTADALALLWAAHKLATGKYPNRAGNPPVFGARKPAWETNPDEFLKRFTNALMQMKTWRSQGREKAMEEAKKRIAEGKRKIKEGKLQRIRLPNPRAKNMIVRSRSPTPEPQDGSRSDTESDSSSAFAKPVKATHGKKPRSLAKPKPKPKPIPEPEPESVSQSDTTSELESEAEPESDSETSQEEEPIRVPPRNSKGAMMSAKRGIAAPADMTMDEIIDSLIEALK